MKKLVLITCFFSTIFLLTASNVKAQNFQENDVVINAGVGLGTTYSWTGSLGIPVGASLEYGITNLEVGSIGVGGDVGFVSGSGLTIFYLGSRGSYYFNEMLNVENEKLDIYGGLGLYYRNFSYSGSGTFSNGIVGSFHLGSRYYFSDNIGAYGELGNSWGWLNVGVTVKL